MERRGNRSALCMKRGTQAPPSPNWGPPHFTSLAINDEHQHVSRETKRIRLCTHVGSCNRSAYTIHPVNVQSSFDRHIERFTRVEYFFFARRRIIGLISSVCFSLFFLFLSLSLFLSVCLYLKYRTRTTIIRSITRPQIEARFFLLLLEIVRKPWE